MTESTQIPDQAAREAAATTFDRNVVVIAGREPERPRCWSTSCSISSCVVPIRWISRIVALTFTNKAATEMKLRLRERLRGLIEAGCRDASPPQSGTVSIDDLRLLYGWTTDDIVARATAAWRDLEKAQIGTLHSFAAHLLRLYPDRSGRDTHVPDG